MKKPFRKFLAKFAATMGILSSLLIIAIPLTAQLGVLPYRTKLLGTGPRHYALYFVYDDGFNEENFYWWTGSVKRGDKFDYTEFHSLAKPEYANKVEDGVYRFLGWDFNGDKIIDTLPTHAYSTRVYRAVFFKYEPEQLDSENLSTIPEVDL